MNRLFLFLFWCSCFLLQRAFSPEGLSEMWNEMVKDEEITFSGEESAHPGMTPVNDGTVSGSEFQSFRWKRISEFHVFFNFRGLHWLLWIAEKGWTQRQREERGGRFVHVCTSLHHWDLGLGAAARWECFPGKVKTCWSADCGLPLPCSPCVALVILRLCFLVG